MTDIQTRVRQVVDDAANRLAKASFPTRTVELLHNLALQTDQPCVVAVVGRVKQGKSSFINALLGDDLAKVGTTETTATINYFQYGVADPTKPVRCMWRDGSRTQEPRVFLDQLQSNDIETLRLVDGIHHLEYLLANDFLREATLVDTPGTGALVEEHQVRTAEYIGLARTLRERHHKQTKNIGNDADAVIYLVGAVAGQRTEIFWSNLAKQCWERRERSMQSA